MVFLYFCLAVIVVIIIVAKIHSSYELKVKEVIDLFDEKTKQYHKFIGWVFRVNTYGLKVSRWNNSHKMDYVINQYGHQLLQEIKDFEDLKVWWKESMPNIKSSVLSYGRVLSSKMFLFGRRFDRRIDDEINNLVNKYNPKDIKIRLITYSTRHESQKCRDSCSGRTYYTKMFRDHVSFNMEITPEELQERLQYLKQFDFKITQYQYECENQRALMTKKLRDEIISRDSSICQICGKYCSPDDIEIDHIKPISKGGKTIESNLQVLCVSCNRSKSNKWKESFENLKKEHYVNNSEISEHKNVEIKKNVYQPKNHFKSDRYGNVQVQNHMNKPDISTKDTIGVAIQKTSVNNTNSNVKWIKVESSNVIQTYYNLHTKSLYIMFKSSAIYVYYDVPSSVFMEFISSASKGSFVRTDLYPYKYKRVNFRDVK